MGEAKKGQKGSKPSLEAIVEPSMEGLIRELWKRPSRVRGEGSREGEFALARLLSPRVRLW